MENEKAVSEATTPLLPLYQCHKKVRALKIAEVTWKYEEGRLLGARVVPVEEGYAPFEVDASYVRKHLLDLPTEEVIGGYYVVYEDGYKSWSPARAFEESCARIRG